MIEKPFEDAAAYDRLEALFERGVTPKDPDAGDLAGELEVVGMLMELGAQEAKTRMPRQVEFHHAVLARVKRKPRVMPVFLAMAAAFMVGFLLLRQSATPGGDASDLQVDEQMLARADHYQTRGAMVEYLQSTERLLVSIRDAELSCSADGKGADIAPERELAQELLMRHKRLSNKLADPRYFRAKRLFSQLENILVDVKNLDSCEDPFEVELINEHINEQRILGKLRLIAQEIEIS